MCKVSHVWGCIESQGNYQRAYSDWILKDGQIFAKQRNRQRENLWPYIEALNGKCSSNRNQPCWRSGWRRLMEYDGVIWGIYSSKEFIYYLAYMRKIATECKCLKVLLDVILRKGKWRPCGRRAGECQSPGFNLLSTVRNPRVEQREE